MEIKPSQEWNPPSLHYLILFEQKRKLKILMKIKLGGGIDAQNTTEYVTVTPIHSSFPSPAHGKGWGWGWGWLHAFSFALFNPKVKKKEFIFHPPTNQAPDLGFNPKSLWAGKFLLLSGREWSPPIKKHNIRGMYLLCVSEGGINILSSFYLVSVTYKK